MDILENDQDYQAIIERFKHRAAANQDSIATYERKLATWRTAAEQARAEGKPEPSGRPLHPLGRVICRPGALYNAMIAPLIPYAIQGVIWYQGESNASRAAQYKKLFPNMILSWRRAWGQGDFPFLFVQLANYQQPSAQPDESHWAELRESQTQTLSLVPRTGMAIAIDIGDANDIHPANKQDVGKRLAQCALKVAYGQEVPHTGPIYDHMVVREGKVRLYFKNVAGNLVAKDNQALEGFAIAGQDRQFVWAEARIVDEQTIEVSNINVPEPVAVRYAWANNPICNLYDAAGLPASPFRSDDWATPTTNER
ncbi:MAG: sialate O-acetylesterase [Phycisphaerales bacterium]|nr:sialate O-acetylesterase [Phycisphaerales bacterium]